MGMHMNLRQNVELEQRLEQRQRLTQTQRLSLKQLLLLTQTLKDPEYPNAAKGLEGMQTAHKILQERNAVGILIGGLAEAVWNQQRTPEELEQHKDVDVAVLDEKFELKQNLEAGIDWWLPHTKRFKIRHLLNYMEGDKTWYENGNGAILSFGIAKNYALKPGLNIPNPEWIIKMRQYEAQAHIDTSIVKAEIDEDVLEKFSEKMKEKIKTKVPKFIQEAFAGYIAKDGDYDSGLAKLELFDIDTVRAIKSKAYVEDQTFTT